MANKAITSEDADVEAMAVALTELGANISRYGEIILKDGYGFDGTLEDAAAMLRSLDAERKP